MPRQQRPGGVVAEPAASDGIGDDREAGAVVEDGLHVHLGDHVGDAGQDVVRAEHGPGTLDGLREARSVAGGLAHGVRDQRGRLRHVQPEPAGPSGAGQLGRPEQQQPVTFRGGQSHVAAPPCHTKIRASL